MKFALILSAVAVANGFRANMQMKSGTVFFKYMLKCSYN